MKAGWLANFLNTIFTFSSLWILLSRPMQKNVANAMAAKCSSQKEEDHLIIIISSVARPEQCTKKMISHFEPSKSIIILHSNIQQNNHTIWYGRKSSQIYRVSHSKVSKVILLWWGCTFWFLLIFWVLHVHEIGAFMPNSSVFIFLMLRALYWMISKSD